MRLWTHPNPKGKKGKELCDCLVVCGPHVVIVSVKDNEYRETDDSTGWERWTRAAIDASVAQISGAERWLETVDQVERSDGRIVTLPDRGERQYHRVAVALGSHGEVPIEWGDKGKGFVHVCDEYSLEALFLALDTITDFVDFLQASEALVHSGASLVIDGGGIEDLVALYLLHDRSFEIEGAGERAPDVLIVQNDLWSRLVNSDEFRKMQAELEDSYVWDRLIEHFTDDLLSGGMFDMHCQEVSDNELALVTMARQSRSARASLGSALKEFLERDDLGAAARLVKGECETAFVFSLGPSTDRDTRARELALRCLVVRGRLQDVRTVVGIATDRPGTSEIGYSSDIVYLDMPTWTDQNQKDVERIQEELGYFRNVRWNE